MKARRNLFMSTTLMCFFLAVAFTFDWQSTHWLWSGKPQVPVVLLTLALVLGCGWLRSRQRLHAEQK